MKKIYIAGFMASGKTTMANMLQKKENLKTIDTDTEIEKLTKTSIDNIFKTYKEKYFRQLETKILKKFFNKDISIISTGGGTFQNNKNIKIAKKNGIIIFLDVSLKNTLKRATTKNRPILLKSRTEVRDIYIKRKSRYKKIADLTIKNNSDIYICYEKILNIIKNIKP